MATELAQDANIAHDTSFVLDAETLRAVEAWVEENDTTALTTYVEDLHAADFVELIEKINPVLRADFIGMTRGKFNYEIFEYLPFPIRSAVVRELDAGNVAQIINELDSDDALDLLIELDKKTQTRVMRNLSGTTRAEIEEGLAFPEASAGRLMQREVVSVQQFWTVGKTLDYLRAASGEELPTDYYALFTVDAGKRVTGRVPISRLLSTPRAARLTDILDAVTYEIPALMDQEDVAWLFRRHGLVSAPVIDETKRLLGVITVDDVIDVVQEEAAEDILNLAGVGADNTDIASGFWITTWHRFKWLFVNLLTAFMASAVIGFFEGSIKKVVALAVLAPIVAGMGGNSGTQTLAVAVRALATKELTPANAARIIWKETIMGGANGFLFALLTGAGAAYWYHDALIGIVIGLAMITNMIAAGFSGIIIPVILNRIKIDPAVGSAVILTTVTDCVGFFSFLGIATVLLRL